MRATTSPILLVNQTIGPLFEAVIVSAQLRQSVEVFRGLAYRRSSGLDRLLTWAGYCLQLAWHLLIYGRRYQRLLVVSNPPLAPLLAPLAGRPFALLLYDLYPQVLAQLQPRNPVLRFLLSHITDLWHRVNSVVFCRAERVFTLTQAMAEEIRPAFANDAVWRSKVIVIPPWAVTAQHGPIPPSANHFRRQQGLDGRLLVSYSGNLGFTHPLEPLLGAAALLKGSVQILIIGTGPKRLTLEQLSRSLELSPHELRFLDPLPLDQLPYSIAAADLAVVALDGPASAASLPSKTFTALALGTPILAISPLNSALGALILQHGCGVVIEPGSLAASDLFTVINELAGDPVRLTQLADAALSASHYYTPANAERLLDCWLGSSHDSPRPSLLLPS